MRNQLSRLIVKALGIFMLGVVLSAANKAPLPKPQPPEAGLWQDMKELGPRDVELYRSIWELHEKGEWNKADKLIKQVENPILMGHVQYLRYMHPTKYRSRYSELSKWMSKYADHPNAARVYKLAKRRQGNARAPKRPFAENGKLGEEGLEATEKARTSRESRTVRNFRRQFYRDVSRTRLTKAGKALFEIIEKDLLSPDEIGNMGGRLARAWYDYGNDIKALDIASRTAELSKRHNFAPHWVAGLAAWRQDDCLRAGRHFAEISHTSDANEDILAAGAFWAARANLVCEKPAEAYPHLRQAALYDLTFYGQIAARQLHISQPRNWEVYGLTDEDWALIKDKATVKRAIALIQIGEAEMADREVRTAWKIGKAKDFWPLIKLATSLDLPESQVRIAEGKPHKEDTPLSALYPEPGWQPQEGFSMDRALVYALIRQESRFASWARSHAGARGLMQVMPRTASFIAKDRKLVRDREQRLYDPEFNMSLGQRYLVYLSDHDVTYGNLFMVLAAYNGGPGNLSRWIKNTEFKDDPLLFIESIPRLETRNYIEYVMSNYWLYRSRFGQDTPSLDAVASGAWPTYEAQDEEQIVKPAGAVAALLN
ncbi:MAG: lytic transglycosylase domain-containing protein [Sphingomonadales bacterium]|jgi:soluble lytic murein transglycosylase-like protein